MLNMNHPLLGGDTRKVPEEWMKWLDECLITAKSSYNKSPANVPPALLIPGLLRAIALYLGMYDKDDKKSRGIAFLTDGNVIAEVNDGVSSIKVCIANEKTGEIRASEMNTISHQTFSLVADSKNLGDASTGSVYTDGSIIWLAKMPQILEDFEAKLAMEDLETGLITENKDEIIRSISVLNDNVVARATDKSLPKEIQLTIRDVGIRGPFKEVSFDKIASGEYQISNVMVGEMSLFEGVVAPKAKIVEIDENTYNLGVATPKEVIGYKVKNLTGYKPTSVVEDVCRIVNLGQEHPELLINNFYFIGPPGAGKSKDAEAIAFYLGLPFYVLGLSSGVTEETLRGIILPSLATNILNDDEKAAVEKVSKLFPTDMAIDITPAEAFEQLTGENQDEIDLLTVYQEAYSKLYSYAEKLETKPADGVSYTYIPSSLVLAGTFGGVIDVQEASSASDPTTLSCINEFMNKPDGVLDTPAGQIKRHPNCIVIMTDNFATDIGYSPMNQAVKDRAGAMSFWYENPTPAEMVARAVASGITVEESTLYDMAETVAIMADVAADPGNSIKATAGYRSFLNWAKAVQMGFTVKKGFELAVVNKMATNPEERELLMDASAGTPIQ